MQDQGQLVTVLSRALDDVQQQNVELKRQLQEIDAAFALLMGSLTLQDVTLAHRGVPSIGPGHKGADSSEAAALKNAYDTLQQAYERERADAEGLREGLEARHAKLAEAEQALAEQQQLALSRMEAYKTKAADVIARSQEESKVIGVERDDALRQADELRETTELAQKAVLSIQTERDSLKQTVDRLQTEKDVTARQLRSQTKKAKAAESAMANLEGAHKAAIEREASVTQQLTDAEGKVAQLSDSLQAHAQTIATLRRQLSDAVNEQGVWKEKHELLMEKHGTVVKENENLRLSMREIAGQVQAEVERGAKAAQEKLKEELQQKSEEADKYRVRVDELEAQLQTVHHPAERSANNPSLLSRLNMADSPRPADTDVPGTPRRHTRHSLVAPNLSYPELQERARYVDYMATLPFPLRPPYGSFVPVLDDSTRWQQVMPFEKQSRRNFAFFPGRTIWCSSERVHALVFAPTLYYFKKQKRWVLNDEITRRLGREIELFVEDRDANGGRTVVYAGTYKILSLRSVHQNGSRCPRDVSISEITRAMGIDPDNPFTNALDREASEQSVECFGLQCVGFEDRLYRILCESFGACERGDGEDEERGGKRRRVD
ncbi:hypothetical protein MKEN_00991500 [Mycena kentingensis (nom. inval.)]|nr:hypothetical protein MKEN_00991500 [Mycena kentingensis (nom. inval.)]